MARYLYRAAAPPRPPDRGVYRPPRRPALPAPKVPRSFVPARRPSVASAAATATPPGAPDYAGQAGAQVSAQLNPILRNIADRYNQQALGTSAAIGGLTNQYASRLGAAAANVGPMFEQAKGPMSAAAEGINAQLTNLGRQVAGTESAAMAAAHQPQGSAGPDLNLAQEGAGAGQAAGAIGQAMINALQKEQQAATEYAGKLPGFAQLEGQQNIQGALSRLSAEMASQLAETTAQAPQLYWTIYQQLQDRANTDRNFAEQVREFNVQQTAQTAQTAYGRRQDRLTQFRQLKDQNEQATGYQYEITSTGVRPRRDAKGRQISTISREAAETQRWVASQKTQTAGQKLQLQTYKTQADIAKAQAAQAQQQAKLQEQIRHNRAIEKNQAASVEERRQAAKDRDAAQRRSRRIKMAQDRTKATGNLWVVGPNGIRLAKGPDGKPVKVQSKAGGSSSGGGGYGPGD